MLTPDALNAAVSDRAARFRHEADQARLARSAKGPRKRIAFGRLRRLPGGLWGGIRRLARIWPVPRRAH